MHHNFIFRKEPGQRWQACNRNGRDQKWFIGGGHIFFQPPHIPDILGIKVITFPLYLQTFSYTFHGMDHRACPQEEASFEEGMSNHMKKYGCICTGHENEKHKTKLSA